MELLAIAEALRSAQAGGYTEVAIVTDSKYCVDALTKWVHGWRKRGFKTADGKPVANREVIEEIYALQTAMTVSYRWIKAHAGHSANERVDDLARRQSTAWQKGNGRPAGPGMVPAVS
jgi:ribonuclease HI